MSNVFKAVRAVRRKLGPSSEKYINNFLYEFVYRLPMYKRMLFVNSGYLPMQDSFRLVPPFDQEPIQANLYEYAARTMVADAGHAPKNIVDLGCGRGAGTAYLSVMFPEARVTGIEYNATAVRQARKRTAGNPNVSFRVGDAGATGLPDESFDFLVSVGAMTYVGYIPFLAEAKRLVKPGSYIAITAGVTGADMAHMRRAMTDVSNFVGLTLVSTVDMTENVFNALEADIPRREALVASVPSFLRGYAREWSDLPGTERYENYRKGIRTDFGVLLRR